MSTIQGTPVQAPIVPGTDDRNTWATHFAKYGAGGFQIVANDAERNSIPQERLADKMIFNLETNKFNHFKGNAWVETTVDNVPPSVLASIKANADEIARLKTNTGTSAKDVYSYRGKGLPTLPSDIKSAYYISVYALDKNGTITLPDTNVEDTIFVLDNTDLNNSIFIQSTNGVSINQASRINVPADNMVFLVRAKTEWTVGFSGLIPSSLNDIVNKVKAALPQGSSLDLNAIQSALKDRLHTFREIQAEFNDQLHTINDLKANGFVDLSIRYGVLDSLSKLPTESDNWTTGRTMLNRPVTLVGKGVGKVAYLGMIVPKEIAPIIRSISVRGIEYKISVSNYTMGGLDYKLIVTKDAFPLADSSAMKIIVGLPKQTGTSGGTQPNPQPSSGESWKYLSATTQPAVIPTDAKNVIINYSPYEDDLHQDFPSLYSFENGANIYVNNYDPQHSVIFKAPSNQSIGDLNEYTLRPYESLILRIDKDYRKIRVITTWNDEVRQDADSWVIWGYTQQIDKPTDDTWIHGQFQATKSYSTDRTEHGDIYFRVLVPVQMAGLVNGIMIDNTSMGVFKTPYKYKNHNFVLCTAISPTNVDSPKTISVDWFDITKRPKPLTDAGIGVVGDDGTANIGITDIEIPQAIVEVEPKEKTKAFIKPYIKVSTPPKDSFGSDEDKGLATEYKANAIKVMPPLQAYSDPDSQMGTVIELKHGEFEKSHPSGYLAYNNTELKILAKKDDDNRFNKGAIWFDNVIVENGQGISINRAEKTFGVQYAGDLDPNEIDGQLFLISARVCFKGVAPNGGFIRLMLANKIYNPMQEDTVYVMDESDNIMAVEKYYQQNEELGYLDLIGIVKAKGLQEFKVVVYDSFANDSIEIENHSNGVSGIMIQELKKGDKTGRALLQYENDTDQNINYASYYFGQDVFDVGYLNAFNEPLTSIPNSTVRELGNGFRFVAINGASYGVVNNLQRLSGTDFNFGNILGAEKTRLLMGRDLKVSLTLQDSQSELNLTFLKWTGVAEDYTKEVFGSREQNGSVLFDAGWEVVDKKIINPLVVGGLHDEVFTFTIPSDAKNVGFILYPSIGRGTDITLKEFKLDVAQPFYASVIKSTDLLNESHLAYDLEYSKFTGDLYNKFGGVRYTLNNTQGGLPMPVGTNRSGKADVELDTTVNQVAGTQIGEGEGALKFNREGKVIIKTKVNVWNEQSTNNAFKFWWAIVSADGQTFTKIDSSELTGTVSANNKGTFYNMPPFSLDVKVGDRIALRGYADKSDGAFINCVDNNKPLVDIDISFKEVLSIENIKSDIGMDFSSFRDISNVNTHAVREFTNTQTVTFNLDVPKNVSFALISSQKTDGNALVQLNNVSYTYDKVKKQFEFELGEVCSGKLVMGFYKNN